MQRASHSFRGTPASVQQARGFTQDTLQGWQADAVEWAAAQLVSELATNAVLHARTDFDVELCVDGDELLIRLSDHSPRAPVRRAFGADATTGRGLALIARLSRQWGVELEPDGKTVWCSLSLAAATGDAGEVDGLLDGFGDLDDPTPPPPGYTLLAA